MQLDQRLRGQLPPVDAPQPFVSGDGRIRGWKVTIPGRRPLATPAVSADRVFLGGGFGSYEFYAFEADSGRLGWQYQTMDDGPTAAVVLDDLVAFNTESCEVEVLTVAGTPVWKKWLGDPLMSMPALAEGRLYQAFPDSRGDHRHYLGCFELRNGNELWRTPIAGEVITAPVLAEGHVYLTTLEGTVYCLSQGNGQPVWKEPMNATSSPTVRAGRCYYSQRHEVHVKTAGSSERQQTEHVAGKGAFVAGGSTPYASTASNADYLDHAKRARRSPRYAAAELSDAAVGFGAHKGDAKMAQAMNNLGHAHVSSIWAYQGSKPFLAGGRLYSALAETLHCLDPESETVFWKKDLYARKEGEELLDSVLTPPVLVNRKVFAGTILGDVYCLAADSGEMLWKVNVGEPIAFQPAVARGRVFVSTHAGSLFALETGDERDNGWQMWGAAADHNGPRC
jgi:outer membrane protein assembly factor BamB